MYRKKPRLQIGIVSDRVLHTGLELIQAHRTPFQHKSLSCPWKHLLGAHSSRELVLLIREVVGTT